MSTQVLEPEVDVIIEDHTPIEQPDTSRARLANRYLFLALDVLTPSRKRSCKRLQFGGHEVVSECLAHTPGFVQRGRITPLVRSGEPILEENAPEGSDFFPIIQPPKIEIPGQLIMQGSESPVGAIAAYPGDHFSSIMNGSGSEIDGRKIGLVEITALRGKNYSVQQLAPGLRVDKDIWEIQRFFFPSFPRLPRLMTEFRQLVRDARSKTSDSTYHSIADDMETSFEIGGLWANETLDAKDRLIIQSRGHQGYAYVYDELDEVLFEQLGREKIDQGMSKMVGQFAEIAQTGRADMATLAQTIVQGNREFAELLLKGLQAQQIPQSLEAEIVPEAEAPKSQVARPTNKKLTKDE